MSNIKFAGDHALSRADGVVFALGDGVRTGAKFPVGGDGGQPTTPQPGAASTDAQHTNAVAKVTYSGALMQVPYAPWGSNNLRPDDIATEMRLSGIGMAGLEVRKAAHYSNGPFYFKMGTEQNKDLVIPLSQSDDALKDIWVFHERCTLDPLYYEQAILDREWWGRALTEYVLSPDASKVVSVRPLKVGWGRWSVMNEVGRIEWLLYSANWRLNDTSQVSVLPVADPWWTVDEVRAWSKKNNYRKFVRCVGIVDPIEAYYPNMPWHATFDNGWLRHTNAIPALKDAAMSAQVNWKWHVRIPFGYWEKKFEKNWAEWEQPERDTAMQTVLDKVIEVFAGKENAGKVIFSGFGQDEAGKAYPGWEILPLDDKLKDGQYIPDADKGNSEILATMGVDWTLLGQGGGASSGAGGGSGSDKREAWTILNAMMQRSRAHTTDAFYFTRDYNGWDAEVQTGFRQVTLTTLDKNPTGRETVAQS